MQKLIQEYRGWEIFFDTEKEEFYTVSNQYDKDSYKKSFSATKKFIDEYIKENSNFKPFYVLKEPSIFTDDEKIKIIGIRKDGKFIYETKNGEKKQLSQYNESDYFLVNHENDKHFLEIKKIDNEIKKIDNEIEKLRTERKKIASQLIKVSVKEYRNKLLRE